MNVDQIIGKLMGDGSAGEEKSALEAWKKEAEENIKALEDIRKIASLSTTLKGYEDFDVDSAWNSFSSKLEDEKITEHIAEEKKTKVFSLINLSRVAAVLVLVLGSMFVFSQYFSSNNATELALSYAATTNVMDVSLKDGSQVTLDKNSDLKVLEDRIVELKGRAHFDVERDVTKQFKIQLPVGHVVVLGTEFTIDANENTTEVYVSEGSVQYELADRTWILVEGDLVKVVNNDVTVLKGRNENYDSWKNQRLMFRDNNMVEVIDALSRHFKKEIIIEHPKAFAECNVVNVFTNASLNDILNDLRKSHGLKYEIRDNKVYIVSSEC